jgi:hypothetical protein
MKRNKRGIRFQEWSEEIPTTLLMDQRIDQVVPHIQ